MSAKHLDRPPSEHSTDAKNTGPAGKETQPDNSNCMGVDNKCTGFGGIEEGSSRNVGYEGS